MIKDERLKQKLISAFLVLVSSLSLIISDVISILKGKEEEKKKTNSEAIRTHVCVHVYKCTDTNALKSPH